MFAVVPIASGFEYAMILNIPEFWICQGYAGFTICLNNSWICLNISDYVWISLNIPEYTWIGVNLPEWLSFTFLHFPIGFPIPCLLEHVITCLNTKETRGYSLKECETVFLKRENSIFYIATGSIWFAFCFTPNIFTSKIQIWCYLLGPSGGVGIRGYESKLSQNLYRNHVRLMPCL